MIFLCADEGYPRRAVLTGRGRPLQYADWSVMQTSHRRSSDMPDAILEARMRVHRSSYRDGLSEIMLGIILLQQIGGNLIIHSGYVPGIVIYFLLLFAFVIYARRILDAVRERITYRRSGYVHELARGRRIVVGMVLALLATSAIVVILRYAGRSGAAHAAEWVQWFPALAGLGVGAVEVYVSMRYGVRRSLVVGIFSMILGIVVSIEYPLVLALTIWCTGFGCANLCSGGVALLSYLKTPPLHANET
jgi:hypothetical protein